ncbi:MAG: S8 family peptidase [Methylococcus sp.]|nr:S8 family peptidase [Methylococcus sp.]
MSKLNLKPWVSILLAAVAHSAWSAEAELTAVVMLKSDVGADAPHPIDSALLAQLQAQAGIPLKWTGNTRTQAQILQLPEGTPRDAARTIARRLGKVEGVLWAEIEGGADIEPEAFDAAESRAPITEIVIKLRGQLQGAPAPATVDMLSAAAGSGLSPTHAVTGAWVYRLARAIPLADAQTLEKRLESLPSVAYADPVTYANAQAARAAYVVTPNDPYFPEMWYLKSGTDAAAGSANLQSAWTLTKGSADITVAVLDSGILFDPTHPDLENRLIYEDELQTAIVGWDMVTKTAWARDGNPRDPIPKDEGSWRSRGYCTSDPNSWLYKAVNSNWHGSHVAGTIGAATDNGAGVSGVDWFAGIEPVRVLAACGGTLYDIADGISWAAGKDGVPGTTVNGRPAQVINMSLGGAGGTCPDVYQEAIDFALAQGATVVVSAGNDSKNTKNFRPANCRGVITVAAIGPDGDLAKFGATTGSNFGAQVTLAAPGGELIKKREHGVISTTNGSKRRPSEDEMNYSWYQGTSMAAPVVSGTVSLMLAADARHLLTPAKIREILTTTARPFPENSSCAKTHKGQCGAGIVDAYAAVKAVVALQ